MRLHLIWILALAALAYPAALGAVSADDQRPDVMTRTPGSQWEKPDDGPVLRIWADGGYFSYLSQDRDLQKYFSGAGGGLGVEYRIYETVGAQLSGGAASGGIGDEEAFAANLSLVANFHFDDWDAPHFYVGAGVHLIAVSWTDDSNPDADDTAMGVGPELEAGYQHPLGDCWGVQARGRGAYVKTETTDGGQTVHLSNFYFGLGLVGWF